MEKWEQPKHAANAPVCNKCLESTFTHFLKLLDKHKLLEGRKKCLITGKTVIVSMPMPMIFGAKGHVNYVFHRETSEVLVDNKG